MNKVLNLVRQLLMILVMCLYFLGSLGNVNNIWLLIVYIIFSFIFISTTLIDLFKKRILSLKRNILQIVFIMILLLFLFRPFLDALLFPYLQYTNSTSLRYAITIFTDNQFIITTMVILLFVNNYIEYQATIKTK